MVNLRSILGIGISGILSSLTACSIWEERFPCDPQFTEIIENSHSQVYRHREEIAEVLEGYIPENKQDVSFNEVAESMLSTPFLCGCLKEEVEGIENNEFVAGSYKNGEDVIIINNITWESFDENRLISGSLDELLDLYSLDNEGFLILDKTKVKTFLENSKNLKQKYIDLLSDLDYVHVFVSLMGEYTVHENTHKIFFEKGLQSSHNNLEDRTKDRIYPYNFATADYLLNGHEEFRIIINEAYVELEGEQ